MDTAERAALARRLHERRDAIARTWQRAIAPTGFPPVGPAEVRRELARLAAEAADLLLADAFAAERARAVGEALAPLRYLAPATLGATIQVLGRELTAGLPPEQTAALGPRLLALLGELAAGFCAAAQDATLAQQEAQRGVQLAEERRAEAARRTSEERLQALLAGAPVVLFALDRAGKIELSAGQGLAALGRRAGQTVGRSIFEVYQDAPRVLADVRRALAGEAFTSTVSVAGATFETRYAPRRDPDGAVVGTIGVATDITPRARCEAALRCYEAGLSPTERKVIPYLAREDLKHYDDIGAELFMAGETVRSHAKAIARKLGLKTSERAAIVAALHDQGLLPARHSPAGR
jgi:PAS domain S-box-containing protein